MPRFKMLCPLFSALLFGGVVRGQVSSPSRPSFGAPRQTTSPTPLARANAQGATVLEQSLAAVGASSPVTDVTLAGNITVFLPGGKTDTGTITLSARGDSQAQVVMRMTTGTRTEVRSISADGTPAEMRIGPDGTITHNPVHSLLTPHPAWFFPQFVLAERPRSDSLSSFVGSETRAGSTVNHLQVWQLPANPSVSARVAQHDSQYDLFLDPATSLPFAMVYYVQPDYPNRHPLVHRDTRAPVEMRFSDYRRVQGVPVALHIQTFIQGRQIYDIQLSSVQFNTGAAIPTVN